MIARLLTISLLVSACSLIQAASTIFPLKDVKPGMKGECHTVFSGTKIEKFSFEIMGIGKDFAGPGKDIVWCKMIDDPTKQMVVAGGMSGSPCFIEGRNMGALAYGMVFNKDPIFGVQPIESMLETLEFQGNTRKPLKSEWKPKRSYDDLAFSSSTVNSLKSMLGFAKPSMMGSGSQNSSIQTLPLPLEISGLHPFVAEKVTQGFTEAGFFPVMGAGGGLSHKISADTLVPGSAISGVIAQGDLNVSVTGTLTWRDGKEILAFGHPMLGIGAVDIPMGSAEIIGVVSSYMRSVKLSNQGGVIGTLAQDRLCAVKGTIGPIPQMTPMQIQIKRGDTTKTFKLEFCDNKFFTPLIYQTALMQFLANVMDKTEESTLRMKCEIKLKDLPSLKFEDQFTGEKFSWVMDAINDAASQVMPLYSNEFTIPAIQQINVQAEVIPHIQATFLEELSVQSLEVEPGTTLKIQAGFQPWRAKRSTREFEIKLPEEIKSGEVELVLADAQKANQIIGRPNGIHIGSSGSSPRNIQQLIHNLNERHANNSVYIFLLKKSSGLEVQNQRLTGLPESVRKVLLNDRTSDRPQYLQNVILLKTEVPFGSVVSGSRSLHIRIK